MKESRKTTKYYKKLRSKVKKRKRYHEPISEKSSHMNSNYQGCQRNPLVQNSGRLYINAYKKHTQIQS